jgi:Na+-driven multidrug efflux pump
MVRKGIPMGLQIFVISLSAVLMVTIVNRSAWTPPPPTARRCNSGTTSRCPLFAVGMAVSAMAAQNVGAGQWQRVHKTARVGVAYSLLVTASFIALVEIFSRPALGLFLPSSTSALAIAEHLNRISAWSFLFFGSAWCCSASCARDRRGDAAADHPVRDDALIRYPLAYFMVDRWAAGRGLVELPRSRPRSRRCSP